MLESVPQKLTDAELRKLQLLQLDILKELDRICRKNDITYSICGGTLLGAVRHKGFIPWDDDVDIAMLRGDYNRFYEVCKTELNPKYYAQSLKTDSEYRWGYGRILLNGTEFVRCGQEHLKARTGVFIDIIPCDSLSDNIFVRKIQRGLAFVMRKMLYAPVGAAAFSGTMRGTGFWMMSCFSRKIPEFILGVIHRLSPKEDTVFVEYYSLMSFREYEKRRVGKKVYRRKKRQLNTMPPRERLLYDPNAGGIKREWFHKTKNILFEDFYAAAVEDYDGWLTYEYGNYMELPPIEEQIPHQTVSKYDFGEY